MSALSKFLEIKKNYIWAKALLSATISGGATGVVAALSIAQPTFKNIFLTALIAGIAGAAMYIKQSPMPEEGE